jgi:RpiR family carbohydrate utilization transcriptional regulator
LNALLGVLYDHLVKVSYQFQSILFFPDRTAPDSERMTFSVAKPRTRARPRTDAMHKAVRPVAPSDVHEDIISVIKLSNHALRPAERRVAETVLSDVHFAVHSSSGELAEKAGVSEPTVTRFSRAVGCTGVRELKVKLAQSLVVGRIYLEPSPDAGAAKDRPALWRSVFEEIRRAVAAAEQQLRPEDVERAAEAIAGCGRLAAFGVGGGSTNAAAEATNRFFRLGISASNHSDPQLMRMVAATLGKGDVVLAISTTGRAEEVIQSVGIARQYGALIVAMTKPGSRLADLADIPLVLHVPEAPDPLKPTASRFAILAALDLLAASTAYRRPREAQELMRRIKYTLVIPSNTGAGEPLGD